MGKMSCVCTIGLNHWGWMDGWVRVLRPFNSISVISRRWKGEHERLCAMKPIQVWEESRLKGDSNARPRELKSGALTARPRGRFWIMGEDVAALLGWIMGKMSYLHYWTKSWGRCQISALLGWIMGKMCLHYWAESWRRFVCLCWGWTSQSTIFQSCRDGATASWVINQYFRGVKCLAQGHNTAAVGFEPPTSRSGVRYSTTEPPRSPSWRRC